MQARRETAVTYSEARLLVQDLKRFELSEGETDESRLLVARFRRMRDEMRPTDTSTDRRTEAEIFFAVVESGPIPLRYVEHENGYRAPVCAPVTPSGLDETGCERN